MPLVNVDFLKSFSWRYQFRKLGILSTRENIVRFEATIFSDHSNSFNKFNNASSGLILFQRRVNA